MHRTLAQRCFSRHPSNKIGKMADDWPFLHLNIISPPAISRINEEQELSLLPFDSSHLEAWTNINFQFDESPVVRFDSTTQSTNTLDPTSGPSTSDPRIPPSSSLAVTSEKDPSSNHPAVSNHFQSSSELPFQLPNEHTVPPFLENSNVLTNTSALTFLAQSTNQPTSDHSLDNLLSANQQIITKETPADPHNGTSAVSSSPNKPAPPHQHSSSSKYDHSSPPQHNNNNNNNNNNSNPSGNEDDDANRVAYDEDKRRRNTLASARFRMKKKMKEQEIERTAREMRERVSELEKQVDSLKQENKWLRGLIVDSTASKLVSVHAQESAELNQLESLSGKRARPTLSPTSDSIHVPAQYQKRPRLSSSATSATTTSKNSVIS
ncbi:hypothetical protein PCANC_17921 [Puccinia coronata f. sp. avenae]|uniref:BZIP domain-containing protein n=1 Tax=Puccinia coronata f. sp. avenae TaxID=200324 RepID=A0A2N5SQD5_9BASI|nr:hypothetical protein PCANC_17921 [Puccinia coronata f. sp. avenae]